MAVPADGIVHVHVRHGGLLSFITGLSTLYHKNPMVASEDMR